MTIGSVHNKIIMTTSRMNPHLHKVIIWSILGVSFDNFRTISLSDPRGFKYSLEQIHNDFQEWISIDDGRFTIVSRIAHRPETSVLDIWRIWSADNTHPACWWRFCINKVTIEFINKLFRVHATAYGLAEAHCFLDNITWGTLSRYLTFIKKNSTLIPNTVKRECRWDDHQSVVLEHFIGIVDNRKWHDWCQKFNAVEEESVKSISSEWALELGYMMRIITIVQSEPTIEPIPVQKENKSMMILHKIITVVCEVMLSLIIWRLLYVSIIKCDQEIRK